MVSDGADGMPIAALWPPISMNLACRWTTQLYIKPVPKTVKREMGKLEKSIAKRRK
jgi:hypothetical protein